MLIEVEGLVKYYSQIIALNKMIQNAVLSDILQPITTHVASTVILYGVGVLLYKRWVEKE